MDTDGTLSLPANLAQPGKRLTSAPIHLPCLSSNLSTVSDSCTADPNRSHVVQELLPGTEGRAATDHDGRPAKRLRTDSRVSVQSWKPSGGITLRLEPGRSVESYFTRTEPPAESVRTKKNVLSVSWLSDVASPKIDAPAPSTAPLARPQTPHDLGDELGTAPSNRVHDLQEASSIAPKGPATPPSAPSPVLSRRSAEQPLSRRRSLSPALRRHPGPRYIPPPRDQLSSSRLPVAPIDRSGHIRHLILDDYLPYLLVDTPIDPEWSFEVHSSIVSFLLACAPPERFSAPRGAGGGGIFAPTSFSPLQIRIHEIQPNLAFLRDLPLGWVPTDLPTGRELSKGVSVRVAMEWIWKRASWENVAWMQQEAPIALFALVCSLSDVHRFRRGVMFAWDELAVYLRGIPPERRTEHERRARVLVEFLSQSDRRRIRYFSRADGTARIEPWREWFEEGADSERTTAVLEEMDSVELAKREGR